MRIAVIGATGALGQELVVELADGIGSGRFAVEAPLLFATSRSAGEVFPWIDDEELLVEAYSAELLRGLDAVILATPETAAKELAPRLRELGITVLDASRAHRGTAPQFFAGRPGALAGQTLVALPSAEALLLARVLEPLGELNPAWVRATILKAASGAGQAGVTDLAEATGKLLNGQEPETPTLPHRLAFNVIPQMGAFEGSEAQGESDLARDLPELLGRPIGVASTLAWAPWFFGHFATLTIGFDRPVAVDAVRDALTGKPSVKVIDMPGEAVYPMPSLATGDEAVLVGRLRADPLDPKAIQLVAAMDNVRASAAHTLDALEAVLRARTAH